MQESGSVASGTTRMGQDEVWWSSPAEVQRVALGIVFGAGVRVYAAGAWWRPTGSGLDCGCCTEQVPLESWPRSISRLVSLILCGLACQSHGVSATCLVFFLCSGSLAFVWGRPAPVCCPATHSSRDPATGLHVHVRKKERESE